MLGTLTMILLNLTISIVATVAFVRMAKTSGGLARVRSASVTGALLSLFLSMLILSPVICLQMIATCIASTFCLGLKLKRSSVTSLLIAAPIVSYAMVLGPSLVELRELVRMRQKFPVESLAARLDYERKSESQRKPSRSTSQLSASVVKQLDQFEQSTPSDWRISRLRMLHDHTTEQFIMAQGFGAVRMFGLRPGSIDLLDDGPISLEVPLASVSPLSPNDSGSASQEMEPSGSTTVPKGSLESLHMDGLTDFFDEKRMGYFQDRDHVTGFQPHCFTKTPGATDGSWRTSWRISRLELIGILKYDKPKAYVSEHLPQLKELAEAPTRDLDAFETAALNRLRTQEDVVIDETPSRIRMVGSLRARTNCLQCHDVQRGELLGALTYELVPRKIEMLPSHSDTAMTAQW